MKKSLYLFLCSLLGVFLFLILHRIGVVVYLYLLSQGIGVASFRYWDFLVLDYMSLLVALLLGAWYGIWLGLYWYEKVYEEKSHGGFADHIARHIWPMRSPKALETKVAQVKERLEEDLWQLEELAERVVVENPKPKVRKVVRKRLSKKLS